MQPGRGRLWALIVFVLLVQTALQAHFFPASELSTSKRMTYLDAPFHQYQMEVAQALCAQQRSTGYDPYMAAGQASGINVNASSKIPALLSCAIGDRLPLAAVYKHVSFWSGVLAPAALVWASLLMRLPAASAALVAVLAVLLWWTGPIRWYHTAGMISYVLAAFVGVPLALAVLKQCRQPSAGGQWAVAAVSALGMLLHPLFLLGALLAGLPGLLTQGRSGQTMRRVARCMGWTVLAVVLVNGWWIWQMLFSGGPSYSDQPYQRLVVPALAIQEMLQLSPTAASGSRLYAALALGSLLCALLCKAPYRPQLLALAGGGVLLMAWASLGAALPSLGALQPNRFSIMAWLCLVLPAAEGVRCAAGYAWTRRAWRRWPFMAAVAAFVLVVVFYMRETYNEVFADGRTKHGVSRPEVKGLQPFSRQMVDYLQTRTDTSARVLFEMSLGRKHDGGHLAALYAWQADREFIGGSYPFLDHANAWDGTLFGKPMLGYAPADLTALLDSYNVGWMVCHSQACSTAMARLPGVAEDARLGPVVVYRRASWPGFVAEGRARILSRCINRIEVQAQGSEPLVLRYHWVPGLRAFPPAQVEPVPSVSGDRPFVRISQPPPHFVLGLGDRAAPACVPRAEPG